MTPAPAGVPLDDRTYIVGRAAAPGAAETRRFLARNGVPHQWVDLDDDPLARLLGAGEALARRRLPYVVFGDGSVLEGPEQFVRTRLVRATKEGAVQLSPEIRRAHLETARVVLAGKVDVHARD